jgi:hypothetical protein
LLRDIFTKKLLNKEGLNARFWVSNSAASVNSDAGAGQRLEAKRAEPAARLSAV